MTASRQPPAAPAFPPALDLAVFRQMAEPAPDYVSSDCAIAARHIRQGMGEAPGRKEHPITLLRIAYGL